MISATEKGATGCRGERQRQVPVVDRDVRIDCGYRLDLVVDETVIVNVKAVASLLPIHLTQLLSYLGLSGLPLGLLINFNAGLLEQGIRRLKPPQSVSVSSVVKRTIQGE
jgi:GxxExxY protein